MSKDKTPGNEQPKSIADKLADAKIAQEKFNASKVEAINFGRGLIKDNLNCGIIIVETPKQGGDLNKVTVEASILGEEAEVIQMLSKLIQNDERIGRILTIALSLSI